MAGDGFLGRWSRLKRDAEVAGDPRGQVESTLSPPDLPAPVAALAPEAGHPVGAIEPSAGGDVQPEPGGPQERERVALPSIDSLGTDSDFSMFMHADVDPGLRVSALKKLFTDPRFNQMDGLDIYIDDYSKPDPMPLAMLKRLSQSRLLGLMEEDPLAKSAEKLSSVTAGGGAPAAVPDGAPAVGTGAAARPAGGPREQMPPDGTSPITEGSSGKAPLAGTTESAAADPIPSTGRQS